MGGAWWDLWAGLQSHSLALFMRLISFSSLMASVMSPLIRSFPDMKASVGFSFPETDTAVTMETTSLRVWQGRRGNRLSVWSQGFLRRSCLCFHCGQRHQGPTHYWTIKPVRTISWSSVRSSRGGAKTQVLYQRTAHLQTSWWSRWNPASWRHQLWWVARPDPRCQNRSLSPETTRPHVLLIWTQTQMTCPHILLIWTQTHMTRPHVLLIWT